MAELARLEAHDVQAATPLKPRRKEQAANGLVKLQRLAGNAAVSSWLAQRQDDAGAGDQSAPAAPAAAAAGMVTVGAMEAAGTISYTLKDGKVTDASAKLATPGGAGGP
jgi:hypothetical protein